MAPSSGNPNVFMLVRETHWPMFSGNSTMISGENPMVIPLNDQFPQNDIQWVSETYYGGLLTNIMVTDLLLFSLGHYYFVFFPISIQ